MAQLLVLEAHAAERLDCVGNNGGLLGSEVLLWIEYLCELHKATQIYKSQSQKAADLSRPFVLMRGPSSEGRSAAPVIQALSSQALPAGFVPCNRCWVGFVRVALTPPLAASGVAFAVRRVAPAAQLRSA